VKDNRKRKDTFEDKKARSRANTIATRSTETHLPRNPQSVALVDNLTTPAADPKLAHITDFQSMRKPSLFLEAIVSISSEEFPSTLWFGKNTKINCVTRSMT
jgi:hypothetical protein